MRPKTFVAVLAVTAVSVVAAGYAVVSQSLSTTPVAGANTAVFPDLLAHANDVQSITIVDAKGKATLLRQKGKWVYAEKGGYPAATDKIVKLAAALANLRYLEPKTDQPDRYGRLDVEDVDQKDAKSHLVTLATADGKALASLIIGKQNYTLGDNSPGGVYVRVPGQAQAWLAEGGVDLPDDKIDWIARSVIDVKEADVQRIVFQPVGAPELTVAKADRSAKEFTLAPVPDGKTADPDAVGRLGGAFGSLTFDDVRADDPAVKPVAAGTADLTTFDGVTVHADLLSIDSAVWLRLKAAGAEGSDAGKQAKTINDAVGGWLFKIPQFKSSLMQPKVDDYLKKGES
jgi:hypothetical protein